MSSNTELLNHIIDNTLVTEVKSLIYRPICIALLARTSQACKNIRFSKDITHSTTHTFEIDFSDAFKQTNDDAMPEIVAILTKTLIDFFKDKKATIHFCYFTSFDINKKQCNLRVDYTENGENSNDSKLYS